MAERGAISDDQSLPEDDQPGAARPPQWLRPVRSRVVALPGGLLIWQVLITVVGLAIVAGGLLLIPLPGPGWVIVFFGLAVWATEFVWAQRLLRWARGVLAQWTAWAKRQSGPVKLLLGLASLLILAGLAYLAWRSLTS